MADINLALSDQEKIQKLHRMFIGMSCFSARLNLEFTGSGLRCCGMDNCKVCMFELILGNEWFDEFVFRAEDQDVVSISLPVIVINNVLQIHSKGQKLIMELSDEPSSVDITLGESDEACQKVFSIPLFDPVDLSPSFPDFDCDAEMCLASSSWSGLVKEFDSFGSELSISIAEDVLSLKSGGELGDMKTELKIGDEQSEKVFGLLSYSAVEDAGLEARFATKYLKIACRFETLSDEVTIKMQVDTPMSLVYDIGKSSHMSVLIAPRL